MFKNEYGVSLDFDIMGILSQFTRYENKHMRDIWAAPSSGF